MSGEDYRKSAQVNTAVSAQLAKIKAEDAAERAKAAAKTAKEAPADVAAL